jgi:hypothetical protein
MLIAMPKLVLIRHQNEMIGSEKRLGIIYVINPFLKLKRSSSSSSSSSRSKMITSNEGCISVLIQSEIKG